MAPLPTTSAPALIPAETRPLGYRAVSSLCRFLLGVFYQRIDVVGLENLSEHGPLVVAANHHNSLVDAMLMVAFLPRRLRTLANAPLFKNPLIGPFLRVMGGLPVHRRQEAGNDPSRNASLFAATTATLRSGGAIMIFPEGRTQSEPILLELRTGVARMVLAAEAFGTGGPSVSLLPVGLVFHAPGTFRDGRALILIGAPIETADGVDLARTEPEPAARLLTDRLSEGIRGLIIEADDRATLQLLALVEELWVEATGEPPPDEKARVIWLQRVMRTYRVLAREQPERISRLRVDLAACLKEMDEAGLSGDQLSRAYSGESVFRFAFRKALPLLISLPLAALGILIHGMPYRLTGLLVSAMRRTEEEIATDKIALGFLLFPLAWAIESVLVFKWMGLSALVAFLVALFPLGFLAVAWRERLDSAIGESRAFLRYLGDRDLPRRLRERRQMLVKELSDLARLVPEIWSR